MKNPRPMLLALTLLLAGPGLPTSIAQDAKANDAAGTDFVRGTVSLRGGDSLEGKIVKKTIRSLFLDVGYTILEIPAEEVLRFTPAESATKTTAGAASVNEEAVNSKRESIFHEAEGLRPGPVALKAREVAESVVKVICAGGSDAPAKSGSGFIIDDREGYVVTNFHVIERERHISVIIYQQTEKGLERIRHQDVKIVAFNPYFDLALLQLENREKLKLEKAFLGDYRRVEIGQPVFAVGSPLGLERSVSQGIVSNRNRASRGLVFIQTTAAINSGNSGGALFNDRGEVIGVTNMKLQGVGVESVGFAIPAHHLKDFLRNYQAFSYDKDNPNSGIRYLQPPSKQETLEDRKVSRGGNGSRGESSSQVAPRADRGETGG